MANDPCRFNCFVVSLGKSMTVYLIAALQTGLVKIGFTDSDVRFRLSSLQTGSPHKLVVLGSWEGGVSLERRLHNFFKPVNASGEWFDFSAVNWPFVFSNLPKDFSPVAFVKGLNNENVVLFASLMPRTEGLALILSAIFYSSGMTAAVDMTIQACEKPIQSFAEEYKTLLDAYEDLKADRSVTGDAEISA